jgi:hypothetical protein
MSMDPGLQQSVGALRIMAIGCLVVENVLIRATHAERYKTTLQKMKSQQRGRAGVDVSRDLHGKRDASR